jgi:hypothetical protein
VEITLFGQELQLINTASNKSAHYIVRPSYKIVSQVSFEMGTDFFIYAQFLFLKNCIIDRSIDGAAYILEVIQSWFMECYSQVNKGYTVKRTAYISLADI